MKFSKSWNSLRQATAIARSLSRLTSRAGLLRAGGKDKIASGLDLMKTATVPVHKRMNSPSFHPSSIRTFSASISETAASAPVAVVFGVFA